MARQSKKLKEPEALDMDAMLLEEQVDPVSGNTAPLGALPAEVRDDIEVNVSPNEFVVNAATVRYFGQEFFDNLQDTAEEGWERIASTGDLPFRDDELEFEEGDDEPRVNFNDGDIVEEGDGIDNVPEPVGGGYGGYGGTRTSFGYDFKTYSNADGNEVRIYFYNGRPLSKIPEGYQEFEVGEVSTAPVATVTSSANNDDNKWARQAGLSSSASNEEILSLMNQEQGYWNTTPDTWTSSDWSNYNKSINNSIKIGNYDLKMNLLETIVTGVAGAATGGLGGLAMGAQIKAGKKKQAEATYKLATEYMDYGMYGGADPRTVIEAAFSAGRLLGKIDEGTDFNTWYKTTNMAKGDITKGIAGVKLPEVNQSKMDDVRSPNPNAATAWQSGLRGEQLYNAMQLHVSSLRSGASATAAGGYVVGIVGGKGREGMLADASGKVVRYSPEGTNMSYPVYMDANGKQYVYTGFFSQVKEEIPSGQEVDYSDPNPSGSVNVSPRPQVRTSSDDSDSDDDSEAPNTKDIIGRGVDFDPMEDIGVTPTTYDDDDSGEKPSGGADNNPNVDGGGTRTTRQGQDNNPNVDGGETRTTRQGADNNPNVDGGQKSDPISPYGSGPNPAAIQRSQEASDQIGKDAASLGPRQTGNFTVVNEDGSRFNRKTLDTEKVKESAKTNKVYGRAEGGLVPRPKKKK